MKSTRNFPSKDVLLPRMTAFRVLATALTMLVAATMAPERVAARAPLVTALIDPDSQGAPESDLAREYRKIAAAGASELRIPVVWREIASKRPAMAANPADSAYDWTDLDRRVRLAAAAGLSPLISIA